MAQARLTLRLLANDELTAAEVARLHGLMRDAFAADEHGGFTEDHWQQQRERIVDVELAVCWLVHRG